jgi:ABC-type antimicrobial peptide transport system permease subunit
VFRLITEQDSLTLAKYRRPLTMMVRVSGNPPAVAEGIRRAMRGSSDVPPSVMVHTESLGIPRTRLVTRFIAGLFTVFGVIALGLSALGVFAIVSQSVTDRKREVAVRISLGAPPRRIVHALLREGNVLVLAGIAIGLFLTKETVGWIEVFLGHVDLYSAPFFGAMCIALFVAMVSAALMPAVRATRLHPMEVLRAE